MRFKVKKERIEKHKSEVLIIGLFEKQKLNNGFSAIDKKLDKEITFTLKSFTSEFKKTRFITTHRKISSDNILLVGLGKEKDFSRDKLSKVSAFTAKMVRDLGFTTFSTNLSEAYIEGEKSSEKVQAITEGIMLGLYDFKKYITVDKDKIKKVSTITIIDKDVTNARKGLEKGRILAENITEIRDLVNEPADKVTPKYLSSVAKKIASKHGDVKVKIFGKKAIIKMGMGALLAVSKGSAQEPQFIILEYKSKEVELEDPYIFVGKGITFDAGGLDIKPWEYMTDMRSDMAGAATVLQTINTIAQLGIKKHVIGIIPTCENLLGSNAFKQGDILKSYNGKTIEVWHTDAEGRLVLADGLGYADKNYNAKAIIDIATLTGASIIALGYEITSLVSSNEELKNKLLKAGERADEKIWELPIIEEYKDLVKGDAGDVRNMSKERTGPGTITAGIFLSNFVEKAPWLHLDIGASGWSPKDTDLKKKGGTGVCLKTFVEYLEH